MEILKEIFMWVGVIATVFAACVGMVVLRIFVLSEDFEE